MKKIPVFKSEIPDRLLQAIPAILAKWSREVTSVVDPKTLNLDPDRGFGPI